jgi:hypothetical protein
MSKIPKKGPTPRRGASNLPPLENAVLILHEMKADEGFEETAEILFRLVQKAAYANPGCPRVLRFSVEGHRTENGAFDHDSWELISNFIPGMLMPYLTEYHSPFVGTRMAEPQRDDIPRGLKIFPGVSGPDRARVIAEQEAEGIEIYDADEHDPLRDL